MQLYASKHIRFLYIITFLDSLLKGLQGFPTLKQIVSLNIGLKSIISDYNQGHIIRELRTRGRGSPESGKGRPVITGR
jgi:hypothetical protein